MLQELCLLKGFSREQATEGLNALAGLTENETKTTFAPMTEGMMIKKVEDVLEELFKGVSLPGSALTDGKRVVFMAVYSKERAVTIMRAVKSVSPDPADIIFAMITETALKWTLQQYIDHVAEEHEYMKTHNPAADPDMKQI